MQAGRKKNALRQVGFFFVFARVLANREIPNYVVA